MHLYRLFLICAAGFSSFPVFSQEEEDPNGRELRLLAWAPTEIPFSLGSGDEAVTVALSTDQFTVIKGKQVPRGNTVEIFAEVPDPKGQPPPKKSPPAAGGNGAPTGPEASSIAPLEEPVAGPVRKILYATGVWPEQSRRAIGFLLPEGSATAPRGKLVMMPDSFELHPEHSMRVINLTGVPLGISLGKKKALLPVRGDLISPFDPGRLRIEVAVNEKGKWRVLVGTNLVTASHYRCFALVRPQVNPDPLFPTEEPDIQNIFEQTSPLPRRPPLPIPTEPTVKAPTAP